MTNEWNAEVKVNEPGLELRTSPRSRSSVTVLGQEILAWSWVALACSTS